MKLKKYLPLAGLVLMLAAQSCDEDTGSLGIPADTDVINSSDSVFDVYTRSLALGSVLSNSVTSYLGDITDPETGTRITADFAAQFHTFEGFKLPQRKLMFPQDGLSHDAETIQCDSCEIRLYFGSFYGDGNNPMKLEVYPLSRSAIIEEGTDYYSNTDLTQFLEPDAKPIATKVFTPKDYILTESELQSSTHNDNVRIVLPQSVGTEILNHYYEKPGDFRDSYNFIRNVCPGFYFRLRNGEGTMLNVDVSTMNIYFTYYDEEKPDTAYDAVTRFAATPEVIQTTHFRNDQLQQLIDTSDCTFLKTPAGICTEATLPIKEIYARHEADSVNKAQLTLTRYNNRNLTDYSLGIPSTLLLLRKQDMYSFFTERKVANSLTSYTTTFNSSYNTYTFENLGRLISYCQHEKIEGMAQKGQTEDEWEAEHPDWNRVVLIPVKISTTTDGNGYTQQVSVTHDMDMNSVRLVGGPGNPVKMQVIYSNFR